MEINVQAVSVDEEGLVTVVFDVGGQAETHKMHPSIFRAICSYCFPAVIRSPEYASASIRNTLDLAGLNRG